MSLLEAEFLINDRPNKKFHTAKDRLKVHNVNNLKIIG
jgi:hypothetical protein